MGPRLLRKPEVLARLGIKKTQLDEAIRDGRFPAPTKILEGGRAEGWFSDEIEAYVESRRAARDQAVAG